MKVLFASLARIGDYLQHMQIVQAWSLANPLAEVHVLVNDLIPDDLKKMYGQFSHVVFPRFDYQKKINQFTTPLLYPFFDLRKLVTGLRAEKYDQLFDLSLQSQSGLLLKLIDPGFVYSKNEISAVNAHLSKNDSVHLIDRLKSIYGITLEPKASISLGTDRVLFQVTTSDVKKNIDLGRWQPVLEKIRSEFAHLEIFVVGSSQERSLLQSVFKKTELLICGFNELSFHLGPKTKLISLDTSIKHYAALFHTPTLEISVGSSHWIKNASYQTGNYVLSADYPCRPCAHSKACPLGRNECQDEIDFIQLQSVVTSWIQNEKPDIWPDQTINLNGNLSIQRGEKWNQKVKQANHYL